ncbi:PilZ domain-containing protein [bacterium]|nr:PilZ domain-containing protein [bacterium]
MRQQIIENKEFNIISRSINNACKCDVIEVCEDCFKVKLKKSVKYETDESVELFTMTPNGQLYFETIVKNVEDNIVSVWFPITYKYLQRREFSRVTTDKEIILNRNDKSLTAKILDISAGGFKLSTQEQLELQCEYQTEFQIENKIIKCSFEPIRIEAIQNYFVSSGRLKNLANYDRIALVQYCFRKQIENSNK